MTHVLGKSAGEEAFVTHRHFLEQQLLDLLLNTASGPNPWHEEPVLEEYLIAQGYDADLIKELIDDLINQGVIEIAEDRRTGTYLVGCVDSAEPTPFPSPPT